MPQILEEKMALNGEGRVFSGIDPLNDESIVRRGVYQRPNGDKLVNFECTKCQYSTVFPFLMRNHIRIDQHQWAYPGQEASEETFNPLSEVVKVS